MAKQKERGGKDRLQPASKKPPPQSALLSADGAAELHGERVIALLNDHEQKMNLNLELDMGNEDGKDIVVEQEFPKAGVKFSWIVDEFIPVICGGHDAIKDMSTDEVLQKFTKALTANDKCSYCHKLQKELYARSRTRTID